MIAFGAKAFIHPKLFFKSNSIMSEIKVLTLLSLAHEALINVLL